MRKPLQKQRSSPNACNKLSSLAMISLTWLAYTMNHETHAMIRLRTEGSQIISSGFSRICTIASASYLLNGMMGAGSSLCVFPHLRHCKTRNWYRVVSPNALCVLRLHVPLQNNSPSHMGHGSSSNPCIISRMPLRTALKCDILIMTLSRETSLPVHDLIAS